MIDGITRVYREEAIRTMHQPSFLIMSMMKSDAERDAYRRKCKESMEAALDSLRLDYEVGPLLGPGRREFHNTPLQRGLRALRAAGGHPAGRLVRPMI